MLNLSQYVKLLSDPIFDYGDILYDLAYNMSFHQKLELIQYNACLAINGAIQSPLKEKLYQELGLDSLQLQCWYRKLGKNHLMCYKKCWQFPFFSIKHNLYKNCFFQSTIIEWNNLDLVFRNLWNSENCGIFNNNILKFIRPKPNSFNYYNLKGITVITQLCLELSHLREHKFKYNFQIV